MEFARSRVFSAVHKLLLLAGTCLTSLSWAGEIGIVTHLAGTLLVKQADGSSKLLSVKSVVQEGEALITQDNTYARLKFVDGGEVVLRPNSQFRVTRYTYKVAEPEQDSQMVSLVKGGMRMVTGLLGKRNPDKVNVSTVTATIGIRGTHFGLLLCQADCDNIPTVYGHPPEDGLHIDVAEGVIHVANQAGQQLISAGQFGYVNSSTVAPVIVPSGQGIQVTMPASISQNDAAGRSVGATNENPDCNMR